MHKHDRYVSPAIHRSVVRSYLNRPTSPARPAEDPHTPKEPKIHILQGSVKYTIRKKLFSVDD